MTKANANDKVRTLIVWETPATSSGQYVEMYVNPEGISINDSKILNTQRTKGGFITQYWGENLTEVSITGKTGSGGIEALNVLKDIYRSEQIALQKILTSHGASIKRRQSLAQLATSVVMWYQGQGLRGFFKDFGAQEHVNNLGIFDYTIHFTVVEIIGGQRKNFLPWQRKPWSTIDTPVTDSGRGYTIGGAYGTNFKMGEMNAPAYSEQTGIISDPEFTSRTETTMVPGSSQYKELEENLKENNQQITPSNLFA